MWERADRIPAVELWRVHERRRERLVAFARRQLRNQSVRRGARRSELEAADEILDPAALTIGFARRFATYKRATLLLRDPERLARLLNQPNRPVQIIFAGKAHPRDNPGKELIQQVMQLAGQEPFRRRMVFLEDYDMAMARYLVQGADVWLNNPSRPMEASGTSGMKAAANGVLNLSTLDGWWAEAWRAADASAEPFGWAIGRGENYNDPVEQDRMEADALYQLLEREVMPTFYDRATDGIPRRWITRMKATISSLCHYFNTHRMVREYTERFYLPAASRHHELAAGDMARSKALAAWKARVHTAWPQVRIEAVDNVSVAELAVGAEVRVRARAHLGDLTPDDVAVELYVGRVDALGEIVQAEATPMKLTGMDSAGSYAGSYLFEAGALTCRRSGLHGYTVRVLPHHPDLTTSFLPGLIAWAST